MLVPSAVAFFNLICAKAGVLGFAYLHYDYVENRKCVVKSVAILVGVLCIHLFQVMATIVSTKPMPINHIYHLLTDNAAISTSNEVHVKGCVSARACKKKVMQGADSIITVST